MKITVREITFTAVIMAMNIVLSSFRIPVFDRGVYLNDIAICVAGIILNPFLAFIAGGVGAFFGDVIFYPSAMFLTLIVRSVQVIVISVFSTFILKKHEVISSSVGIAIGMVIMIVGYTVGRVWFGYATWESSIVKLPFQIGQAFLGLIALPICYKFKLKKICRGYMYKDIDTDSDKEKSE